MLHRITARAVSVLLVVGLSGCSSVEEPESFIRPPLPEDEQSASVGSLEGESAQSDGDVLMSGRYRVGADGRLLRPQDAPIPDKPDYPEAARFETPEGAEAFIHYVIDSYEYMVVSGDTEEFERLGLPNCRWCERSIKTVNKFAQNSSWVEVADMEVVETQFPFEVDGYEGLWNSDITVRTHKLTTYENGRIINAEPNSIEMRAQVQFDNGRWFLRDFGEIE